MIKLSLEDFHHFKKNVLIHLNLIKKLFKVSLYSILTVNVDKEIQQKADDSDKLFTLMKEKVKNTNKREKIQVLTLTPDSWSLRKTA